MQSLNEQEKEVFLKLARSQDADILKLYIAKLIKDVVSVDNLTSDPIQNARVTKQTLTTNLLDLLTETEVEPNEEDTYE
jgi:hypothetical protein